MGHLAALTLIAAVAVAWPRPVRGDTTVSSGDAAAAAGRCRERLARARAELLETDFRPAADTPRALQVLASDDGAGLELSVYTAAAADGLHEQFVLTVEPVAARVAAPWRRRQRSICCDDQAEAEDHVVEVVWTRQQRKSRATLSTVTGRYPGRRRWVALFTAIAKRAADDCLR